MSRVESTAVGGVLKIVCLYFHHYAINFFICKSSLSWAYDHTFEWRNGSAALPSVFTAGRLGVMLIQIVILMAK